MRHLLCGLVLVTLAFPCSAADYFSWEQLPPLPPGAGQSAQLGLAGPFVGVHNDALIVANGANFPEGRPWDTLPDGTSPPKIYHGDIFVLERLDEGRSTSAGAARYKWIQPVAKMPTPFAYGVSIPTDDGLICIGGEHKTRAGERTLSDRCFVLRWTGKDVEIDTKLLSAEERAAGQANAVLPLPNLPKPCANMAGAKIGDAIYLLGGDAGEGATRNFWRLDLSQKANAKTFKWQALPPWPGPPRTHALAVAQHDGYNQCLYLFSGRNPTPLTDAWRFSPAEYAKAQERAQLLGEAEVSVGWESALWKRLADVAPAGEAPRCVMAGTAAASGQYHVLFFGGADGRLFTTLDVTLPAQIAAATGAAKDALVQRKLDILNNHPGFSKDILAYHTLTDTWAKAGMLPPMEKGSPVTTVAAKWGGSIVIPSGEISPGIRTPNVYQATPKTESVFGGLNYAVLIGYLAALAAMGVYFSRRMHSTEDFFKAGGRIPWWAAGISIFGTQLSAITFMSIPSKTYATDWRYFTLNLTIVMIAPFIIFLFLPFYRRLNVTTAYEYLERRFNYAARALGSVMFMILQLGRIGIVLLLPSVALAVVTGMSVETCIIVMGAMCVLYTVLGGMEAVIWTDVLQVVVLAGGALLCLILIPFDVPGGWNGMMDSADAQDKLRMLDFRWGWKEATFFVLLFGGLGQNLIGYGTDQTVIQRYLTTRDEAGARRSVWTGAILAIPASILFFGIGTALFAYYQTHPERLDPTLAGPDAIFPFFIVTQLPAGVAGLLIAAVFAAAMSSLDSSMNSVSAAFTTDFYRRLRPRASEAACLRTARWATLTVGVVGTAFALIFAAQENLKSLWDEFVKLVGLFGGGLGGLFVLAILTRRAHGVGALIGLLVSGGFQWWLKSLDAVHPAFYSFTGIASCFIAGYLASLIIPAPRRPDAGLTIYTLEPSRENSAKEPA